MKLSNSLSKIAVAVAAFSIALALIFTSVCFIKSSVPYDGYISENSEKFGVEKSLVVAVIKAESGFNPNSVSKKGAVGLMQIMPETAEFLAKRLEIDEYDLNDPKINIFFGTAYLKYLSERFNSEKAVIAAYNAGEGRVRDWLKNAAYSDDGVDLKAIPYKETAQYVRRVLKYKKYARGVARLIL